MTQQSLPNEFFCHYVDALTLLAIQERWSADSTGLQRLLTETLKEDDNGGIAPCHVHALRNALSSKNKGPSNRSRQQRREAVVYILRARRRVRLQGQPEISNEWGRIKLLSLIGVTKEELEEDMEMDYIHASIETDGKPTNISLPRLKPPSATVSLHYHCTSSTRLAINKDIKVTIQRSKHIPS